MRIFLPPSFFKVKKRKLQLKLKIDLKIKAVKNAEIDKQESTIYSSLSN